MNRLKSYAKRILSLALALTIVLGLASALPAAAEGEEAQVLHITDKQSLIAFAESCTLDAYSKGLTVYLDTDIDLLSEAFKPIPIFYGSFDGRGHTISGLNISKRGSETGLFRTVEPGAAVRRLKVTGAVEPQGSAERAGIICGVNYGIISGCTAAGALNAVSSAGGIAGINATGGVIGNCRNEASITCTTDTGGIVGFNEGLIENCTNAGKINTTGKITATPSMGALSDLTQSLAEGAFDSSSDSEDAEELNLSNGAPHNTGGIAGGSEGKISGCTNEGTVGYKHLGYNTGGIVGLQNGIVTSCENRGEILGRKDVGGIVGQFEPDIAIKYDSDKKDLESEIDKLSDILRTLSNSLGASADSALTDADTINSAVNAIEDSLKNTTDTGRPELQTSLESVYLSLQVIGGSIDKLNAAFSDFSSISNKETTAILDGLNTINSALEGMDISDNVTAISAQIDVINAALGRIADALGDVESLVTTVNRILQDTTLTPSEQQKQILAALQKFAEAVDANSIQENVDKIVTAANAINTEIQRINSKLDTGSQTIREQLKIILDASVRLKDASNNFSNIMTEQIVIINKYVDAIEDVCYNYASAAIDRWDSTFDTVYGQLGIINTSLDSIIANGKATNATVNSLVNSAIDQFGVVGDAVAALLEIPQYTAVDVSDDLDGSEKPGQVDSCRNSGSVNADVNVGGIAGIMAVEVGDDPEADFDMKEGLWTDTTALFRAVVMTGSNTGAITSKNGEVGGIVGRSDVGAVYKMDSTGAVSASDALCGGIAGSSSGSIFYCNAMCPLSAGDEAGGIAGKGHNISHCRSMVTIAGEGEKRGAVAGSVSGEMLDNIFVKEALAGVDGISYADKAYGLPYEEFVQLPELPEFFGSLHLDFMSEGHLIKRIAVAYGGDVDEAQIPALPSREDSYGVWEPFTKENVLRNQVINSEYLSWEKTVAAEGGDPPSLLAEGQFSDEAKLEFSETELACAPSFLLVPKYACTYELTDPKKPRQESVRLHLRIPEDADYIVSVESGGKTSDADISRDGSYLVFSAPQSGIVRVYRSYVKTVIIAAVAALALVFLIIGIVLLVKRRKQKKLADESEAPTEAAPVDNTAEISVTEPESVSKPKKKKRKKGAHQK